MRHWFLFVAFSVAFLTVPSAANAQYKNKAFGFDVGYMLSTKPSLLDSDGAVLPVDKRPLRLANGIRLAIDTNFKLDEDHWWFNTRFDTTLRQTNSLRSKCASSRIVGPRPMNT